MRRGDDQDEPRADRNDRREPVRPPRSGVSAKQVVIVLVAVVLLAFGIANFDTVEVNFLLFSSEARLVTVIVVASALGFVIGYFVGRPNRLQRKYLKEHDRDRD